VSLDLIFGTPGQVLEEWSADLERALAFGPDHLSTYGLTYEKGTPLWKNRERGRLIPLTEDDELAMYLKSIDCLVEAGFEHYEVSNFAKPGQRCRHNEVYWANDAYHGFGLGAARYVDGWRETNTRDLGQYLRLIGEGSSPTFQREKLEGEDRARETAVVQIRRADGVDRVAFERRTEWSLDRLLGRKLEQAIANDLVADDGQRVKLTRRGFCVADALAEAWL
jgi:oxygen-independent coproporphyrinogen-3 oxidase